MSQTPEDDLRLAETICAPEYADRVRGLGLDRVEVALSFAQGTIVAAGSRREVVRIDDAVPPLYLKRSRGRAVGDTDAGRRTRLLAEWQNLGALRARGVPVVDRVVASFAPLRARDPWFIVTAGAAGEPLSRWLRAPTDPGERMAVAAELGRLAATLSRARLHFRDLVGKHVYVRAPGAGPRLVLIDVDRVHTTLRPAAALRAMIADLLTTIPDPALDDGTVHTLLDAAELCHPKDARRLAALVAARRSERRLRRFLAPDPEAWLAAGFEADVRSRWRGIRPFMDLDTARRELEAQRRATGRLGACPIQEVPSEIGEAAFDAAEQAARFGVVDGLVRGLLHSPPPATTALLVVDPVPDSLVAIECAAEDAPEATGAIVAALHRGGFHAADFGIAPSGPAARDWRSVRRAPKVHESDLRSDVERIVAALVPAKRTRFAEAYDRTRRCIVESVLERLAARSPAG